MTQEGSEVIVTLKGSQEGQVFWLTELDVHLIPLSSQEGIGGIVRVDLLAVTPNRGYYGVDELQSVDVVTRHNDIHVSVRFIFASQATDFRLVFHFYRDSKLQSGLCLQTDRNNLACPLVFFLRESLCVWEGVPSHDSILFLFSVHYDSR